MCTLIKCALVLLLLVSSASITALAGESTERWWKTEPGKTFVVWMRASPGDMLICLAPAAAIFHCDNGFLVALEDGQSRHVYLFSKEEALQPWKWLMNHNRSIQDIVRMVSDENPEKVVNVRNLERESTEMIKEKAHLIYIEH